MQHRASNLCRWICFAAIASACGDAGSDATDAPIITAFKARDAVVEAGATTVLKWKVRHAQSVAIASTDGSVVLSASARDEGSVETPPIREAATFVLTASGETNDATATISVDVAASDGPEVMTFTADPSVIAGGDEAMLTWNVASATSVDIAIVGGGRIASGLPASAAITVRPTVTTSYVITATGPGGATSATVEVVVEDPPPRILRFAPKPSTIDEGDRATLTWAVDGATEIHITDSSSTTVFRGTDASGTVEVAPMATRDYALVASNASGDARETTRVIVIPRAHASIDSFTALPATVMLGSAALLEWRVSNADDGIQIVTHDTVVCASESAFGTCSVTPLETTTYTLVASHPNGDAARDVTVTVAPSAPWIVSFSADPAIVGVGGRTTLSWHTIASESVRIFRGALLVHTTTSAATRGTFGDAVTEPTTLYTLEAINAVGSSTASASIVAQPLPTIRSFVVTPSILASSSTIATIAWDVAGTTRLALFANGARVDAFPTFDSATPISSAEEWMTLVTETTIFELVATSLAGDVRARTVVARLAAEVEPNDLPAEGTRLPPGGTLAYGSLEFFDDDWFSIAVPEGGNISIETSDGDGGCSVNTTVELVAPDRSTVLEENEDSGALLCSRIDPRVDFGARDLPSGTYFIHVAGAFGLSRGAYALEVVVEAAVCGNAIRELRVGETCDDGNTRAGDGCNANCRVETHCGNRVREVQEECDDGNTSAHDGCDAICRLEGTVERETSGNDRFDDPGVLYARTDDLFHGSILPVGDVDYFRVHVPAGHHLEARLTSSDLATCPSDRTVVLDLLASDGTTALASDAVGDDACPFISPDTTPAAWNMAEGDYFVRIAIPREAIPDPSASLDLYFLRVRIVAPRCGNAYGDPGEQCDDGDRDNGDGCDASCRAEIHPTVLSAPGGSLNLRLGAHAYILIEIDATAGQNITAVANDASGPTCDAADTRLVLGNADLALIGEKDDGGPVGSAGECAAIVLPSDAFAMNLPSGSYYLQVKNAGAFAADIALVVGVGDAACGNGVPESNANEQCDSGGEDETSATRLADTWEASPTNPNPTTIKLEPTRPLSSARAA